MGLLIAHKMSFYFSLKEMKNIYSNFDEFVLWQSKLICFVKAVKCSSLLSICFRVNGFDGNKLLSVTNKEFCAAAERFGIVKGPAVALYRNMKKETNKETNKEQLLSKISRLLFENLVNVKKFANLTKRSNDLFIKTVSECNKIENIKSLILNL